MTPAESPEEEGEKSGIGLLREKARALPTPVDSPAKRVSPKANRTFPFPS